MTEVPEYLLERSRERRAALGLGGGGTAPAAAADGPADASPATAAPADAPAPAAAPAARTAAPVEALPTYVAPTGPRSGIPVWMMPVILILPLWAVVYMGAFGESTAAKGPATGTEIFHTIAGCQNCHGPAGEGGVGPKLAAGEVVKTFPTEQDQIDFVTKGSAPIKGQPYGDPNREGGQHVANTGGMPTFGGQLTAEEIKAVVEFERTGL
jgi:mono/diheme cytochrome c family protein